MNPTPENFIAAFKGCTLHSIMHINPRSNQEPSNDSLPLSGSLVINLLKKNKKELETENSSSWKHHVFEPQDEDDVADVTLPDELPDLFDLDRQIVYYLGGFTAFRKKLRSKLCSDCQDIFFVDKLMKEFCTPSDSNLTLTKDHGGLEYVGTAAHKYFCDLEKLVKNFFQQNKTQNWILHPNQQLKDIFAHARVQESFLELEVFWRKEKTCPCDWMGLLTEMSVYYAQLRIHFKCDWLTNNINQKRTKPSDFAKRKLTIHSDLPLSAAHE